ncbi:DUF6268 family outer membrane beta-barrel protein [Pendulispora albinea]|uniref:DUF6268 family outer membrane beta-barrel protein n=1 Tax=Pendulispora albinea TaxID=2741071 RepID=A0ABZ2MAV8_9BACT
MSKITFAAFAALAVVCATKSARAQMADSTVSFTYERTTLGLEQPKSSDTKDSMGVQTFRFRAGYPIPLGPKTILSPGLSYDLVDFPKATSRGLPTDPLHAPTASLAMTQLIGDHVVVAGAVAAGLASDFQEKVSVDDLAFNVSLAAMYRFSSSFSLGMGVAYMRQTRMFFPAPIIAVNWEPSERFRIRGGAPVLNVDYRATPWLTVGLRAAFEGNVFHLGGQKDGQKDVQFSYMTIQTGPKATINLSDSTHLDLYASATPMRRFEYFVDGTSKRDGYLPVVVGLGARLWFGSEGWRSNPWAPAK